MDKDYFRTCLIETIDQDNLSSWKKIFKAPSNQQLYQVNRVITKNQDNSYHYIKNRSGDLKPFLEQELTWILLNV